MADSPYVEELKRRVAALEAELKAVRDDLAGARSAYLQLQNDHAGEPL